MPEELIEDSPETNNKAQAQALLFMDCWGTGDKIDNEPFHGYAYVIRDYAPDFVNDMLPERCQHTYGGVVTILANGLATKSPADIEGYTEVYRYPAGERECPGLQMEDHHDQEDGCHLCEGDDYVYWGEEWQVHVLVEDEEPEKKEDNEEE